jgi:hypothetical protein
MKPALVLVLALTLVACMTSYHGNSARRARRLPPRRGPVSGLPGASEHRPDRLPRREFPRGWEAAWGRRGPAVPEVSDIESVRAQLVATGVGDRQWWIDWETLPDDQKAESLKTALLLCERRPEDVLSDIETVLLAAAKVVGVAAGLASGIGVVQTVKAAL